MPSSTPFQNTLQRLCLTTIALAGLGACEAQPTSQGLRVPRALEDLRVPLIRDGSGTTLEPPGQRGVQERRIPDRV